MLNEGKSSNEVQILLFQKEKDALNNEIQKLNEKVIKNWSEKEYWKQKYLLTEHEKQLLKEDLNNASNAGRTRVSSHSSLDDLFDRFKNAFSDIFAKNEDRIRKDFQFKYELKNEEIKRLQVENAKLSVQNEEMNARISDFMTREDEYLAKISYLEDEISKSKAENAKTASLMHLKEQLSKGLKEYENLQTKYLKLKKEFGMQKNYLLKVEAKIKNLTDQNWHLSDIIRQNDLKHADLMLELTEKLKETETERDNLADEIEELRVIIGDLMAKNGELTDEIYIMEHEESDVSMSGEELRDEDDPYAMYEELELENEELRRELKKLGEENAGVLKESFEFLEMLGEMELENTNLRESLELLEENAREMEMRIEEEKSANENKSGKPDAKPQDEKISKELFGLIEDLIKFIEKLTDDSIEITKTLNFHDLSESEIEPRSESGYLGEIEKLREELKVWESKYKKLREESSSEDVADTGVSEYKARLENSEKQIEALRKENESYLTALKNLEARLKNSEEKLFQNNELINTYAREKENLLKNIEKYAEITASGEKEIMRLTELNRELGIKFAAQKSVEQNLRIALEKAQKDLSVSISKYSEILEDLEDLDIRIDVMETSLNEDARELDEFDKNLNELEKLTSQLSDESDTGSNSKQIMDLNDKISQLEEHIIIMELKNSSLKQFANRLNEIAESVAMMGLMKASEDIKEVAGKLEA